MPVNLVPKNPQFFQQHVEEAKASTAERQKIPIRGPWAGYMPDIDPYNAPATACEEITGLVARPSRFSKGEVLRPDAGYAPTGSVHASTGLPLDGGGGTNFEVTMIAEFPRTTLTGAKAAGSEYETSTLLALVAGDGTTAGTSDLYRLKNDGTTWELIPFSTIASNPASTDALDGDRQLLPDWAIMPAGAPARTAYNGNIDEPAFVWCGLHDNTDDNRVMVYPVDDGTTLIADAPYETLTDQFGGNGNFYAETVEFWNGRLYFGNTSESSTRHRQRVRRTAIFTADPLATAVGAGAFDVRDFSGDLLRLEKLGNVLAAYFTDGTAFLSATEVATSPDRVELLRDRRGLISKWAVTPISDQVHFGIFTDGWFLLDPTGRWTEVGVMDVDGVPTRKWKEDFYGNLDTANRHRLTISYDGTYVRIAYPRAGATENEDVWIYDFRGDRVFKDSYEVVQWGLANLVISTGINWDEAVGSWESGGTDPEGNPLTTWAAEQSIEGLEVSLHGTSDGYILTHDYNLFTRYNTSSNTQVAPTYLYRSKLTNLGDPTTLKTANRIWLEYVRVNDPSATTILVKGDSAEGQEGGAVNLTRGTAGDTNVAWRDANFTSTDLQVEISGTAPIEIRSIMAEVTPLSTEDSFKQT